MAAAQTALRDTLAVIENGHREDVAAALAAYEDSLHDDHVADLDAAAQEHEFDWVAYQRAAAVAVDGIMFV